MLRSGDYSPKHWRNLLTYLSAGCRQILYLVFASRTWIHADQIRSNSIQGDSGSGETNVVEESNAPSELRFPECTFDYTEEGRGIDGTNSRGNHERQPRHKGGKNHRLFEWLLARPTAPLKLLYQNPEWTTSEYKFTIRETGNFKNIEYLVAIHYLNLQTKDFFYLANKSKSPYAAPGGNIEDYYYNLSESIILMNNILLFQLDNNLTDIKTFLNNLYILLDRKEPKKNTFMIISQPNAGKNLFFDAILHYYFSYGMIGNFNKFQSFPLQDCANKRVLMWNEPNIEPSALEELKKIFGGDTTTVKVKHKEDQVVGRTPIIILSNHDPFPKNSAFTSRIIRNYWKPFPKLKVVNKKPYPLSFYYLLVKYKIIDDPIVEVELNNILTNHTSTATADYSDEYTSE